MKTKITLLALLMTVMGFAQQGINYKALIKDVNDNVLVTQPITLRFSILKGSDTGSQVYQETHSKTTDANGIVIATIGEGTPVSGNYYKIEWVSDSHFLKTEVKIGSATYVPIGTTEFKAVPYALNVTGLEKITQNDNTGWRLKGFRPANYGDIGQNAVDLSLGSGSTSGAMGWDSFSSGYATQASGSRSTAMGNSTEAFGTNSTAMGFLTFASGSGSSAMGQSTIASGRNSTAMGYKTKAEAYASLAIGSYNVGGFSNYSASGDISWVSIDPLFEIGNGLENSKRRNALTVLKNGNVGIGNHQPASLLEITHPNVSPTASNLTNAFSIKNGKAGGGSWQFHVNTNGELVLYYKGNYMSYFRHDTGAYVVPSDRRLKKDIVPLEANTLRKVMQLNPVTYQMIDQDNDNRQIGLISPEVKEVFPSLTHLVPDQDILALSYTELIPVLIKAIQEQQTIIESQNTRIDTEKEINKTQNTLLEALLKRVEIIENNPQS